MSWIVTPDNGTDNEQPLSGCFWSLVMGAISILVDRCGDNLCMVYVIPCDCE